MHELMKNTALCIMFSCTITTSALCDVYYLTISITVHIPSYFSDATTALLIVFLLFVIPSEVCCCSSELLL